VKRILPVVFLFALILLAVWSYTSGGTLHLMLSPGIDGETRFTRIQEYFQSWGPGGPIAYKLLVTTEVILAPIPGTILYLPGGALFGWWIGGTMSLAGNVIGAGIACQIMRVVGRSYLERYLESESLKKYQSILESRGLAIVFLLRVNPLTSSDLVSYAAGLTRLPLWKVLTGTFLGMAPLCFIQSYFAEELLTSFPRLVYPLLLIGLAYTVYVCFLLRQIARKARA
jgi:uncharacterized membrane protein YdjX (TVP38/TMEM64 family)